MNEQREDESETAASPRVMPEGRRFQPGVSGNPRGRPKKGQTYMDLLEAKVSRRKVKLANAIIEKALDGDASRLTTCLVA